VDQQAVMAHLRRALPDDAIVTTDAGNFSGWGSRYIRREQPGTFLGPTSGAMGYGVPAAVPPGWPVRTAWWSASAATAVSS
jgi:acetolactate synthase-1/2/3 large subunit